MKTALWLALTLTGLCLTSVAWADSSATRTLTESPTLPAGAGVVVENLVGHMTVSQGASFRVTATVVAGDSQAQTAAQDVKLDVTTSGNQVTVHVHYPVNKYDSYRYAAKDGSHDVCVLGIVCFRGSGNSSLDYQGERVRVYEGGSEGVPLYVNVAVQIPSGVQSKLVNEAGLLEASGLANPLTLDAAGGGVYARHVTGDLTADTGGGDLHVEGLKGKLRAGTGGGDVYVSQSTGDMHLETGGGDAHVDHVTGSFDAHSGGGDLYVTSYTSGHDVSVHTGGGDLHLAGDLGAARDLDVGTGGGDGVLRVGNLSMHLDVSSGGGDISVHLPDAAHVDSSDGHYSGDIGKAQGQGSISAGGGDITVSGR